MLRGREGAGYWALRRFAGTGKTKVDAKDTLIYEPPWLARLYPNEIHAIADYARCASRLRGAMAGHIGGLLAAGTSVVLDFPTNAVTARAWARGVFEKAGAAHRLHYLDVPDEVCKARLRARNLAGEHPFEATDAEFDQITSHFVAPTAEEGYNVREGARSLAEFRKFEVKLSGSVSSSPR